MHESREYEKAIKKADEILSKFPNHAETMAVKALCLNSTKKKDEALALIKLAMLKNLTSFTCWHAYGMISQGDKDYETARKSYATALKYDKENAQIIRDLIMTQMQLREYSQAVESCRTLLQIKPLPLHWLLFATCAYMVFFINYMKIE